MTPEKIARFERLYASPRYMGAARLLREFLSLAPDAPIPLSVAHGVDFGHCHRPMDVDSIEPIHWSFNRVLHEEAKSVKPSILAPHPWAILAGARQPSPGDSVIVIGPPPSPDNDRNLYELIRKDVREGWAILVKARGNYRGSLEFWRSKGLQPITASGADDAFYERLYSILSQYQTVLGCTFSSALVFAAAIGRQVEVLDGYAYEVYEPVRYEDEVNFYSARTRSLVDILVHADATAKTAECRALLGFDMLDEAERIRLDVRQAIQELKRPFHANPRNPVPYKIAEALAMKLHKQGLLRYSPRDVLDLLRGQEVCVVRMNDIDIWLNGKTPRNYQQIPRESKDDQAIPGCGPRGYSS